MASPVGLRSAFDGLCDAEERTAGRTIRRTRRKPSNNGLLSGGMESRLQIQELKENEQDRIFRFQIRERSLVDSEDVTLLQLCREMNAMTESITNRGCSWIPARDE